MSEIKTPQIACAIYCRYSSKSQDDGYSIEAQKEAALEYVAKQGWKVHRIYIDRALSGTSDEREEFQTLINDALAENPPVFSYIIVHKLDRFARNRYDSIRYKHVLKKNGVKVVSVTQPIVGSGDPTEILLESLLEGMDEFYSANLAREAIKGMIQNAKAGFWNGGNPPYGYRLKHVEHGGRRRSKLEIDHAEATVVREVFRLYASGGLGVKAIAMKINDRNMRGRTHREFTKNDINNMLHNEKYAGDTCFGKKQSKSSNFVMQTAKNSHPAIISREDFDRVQIILKSKSPEVTMPQTHNDFFLLSGFLKCKKCGLHFVGKSAKSGRHFYYTCVTRDKKGEKGCSAAHLNKEAIEKEIISAIRQEFLSDKRISKVSKDVFKYIQGHDSKTDNAIFEIVGQLKEKERRLKRLYDAIENEKTGLVSEDLGPRIRELKTEIANLTAQEAQLLLKKEQHKKSKQPKGEVDITEFVKGFRTLFEDSHALYNKRFLRELIDKIEIGDGQADIYWHIPDLSMSSEAESSSGEEWSSHKSPSKHPDSKLKVRAENKVVSRVRPKTELFDVSTMHTKVFRLTIPLRFSSFKRGLTCKLGQGSQARVRLGTEAMR